MASLNIRSVNELIKFVIPLFADEFNIVEGSNEAVSYFLYGGCYELAKVINHYFPDSKYVVRKDYSHVAILENETIYDAYDFYEDWQLKKYNIPEKFYKKKIDDFYVTSKEEIDNFPVEFTRNDLIGENSVSDALIKEIDKIKRINVLKKEH